MKTQFREHKGGGSTLRKVQKLIAKGWKPGMTVAEVMGKRRRGGEQ